MNDFVKYVADAIETLDNDDFVALWNEYCDAINDYDERVFFMSELDDIFPSYGKSTTEILEMFDSDFNVNDDYFKDGYYGIISSDNPCVLINEDYEYIANWCIESQRNNEIDVEELADEFFDELLEDATEEQKKVIEEHSFNYDIKQKIMAFDVDDVATLQNAIDELLDELQEEEQ